MFVKIAIHLSEAHCDCSPTHLAWNILWDRESKATLLIHCTSCGKKEHVPHARFVASFEVDRPNGPTLTLTQEAKVFTDADRAHQKEDGFLWGIAIEADDPKSQTMSITRCELPDPEAPIDDEHL